MVRPKRDRDDGVKNNADASELTPAQIQEAAFRHASSPITEEAEVKQEMAAAAAAAAVGKSYADCYFGTSGDGSNTRAYYHSPGVWTF
ncbi:hypothetical protein COLO4_18060 [Corchorus olitorius]|uniref:Uncharacterized protein n=1 Tax=Corchorus olitorius TaxID=93759 RepID=A0A1R3JAH9_9ROSI|nr:hypothetical protein COLO4_18060 [Corchorus olitorius]